MSGRMPMSPEGRRNYAWKQRKARKLAKMSVIALWVLFLVLLGVFLYRGP